MIYTTHYIQIVIQMVFSKQIYMLIYVNQNNGEKMNIQDIVTPTPRQLNLQFFSIQDILKCEHSLRTKNILKETLAL